MRWSIVHLIIARILDSDRCNIWRISECKCFSWYLQWQESWTLCLTSWLYNQMTS